MELGQCFRGGIAAQSADYLGFKQVSDIFGVEGFFSQASTRSQQVILAMTDVGIEFRDHIHPDLVGGKYGLIP